MFDDGFRAGQQKGQVLQDAALNPSYDVQQVLRALERFKVGTFGRLA